MEKEEEYIQLCEAIDEMAKDMKDRARVKHAEGKKGWKKVSSLLARYKAKRKLNEMGEGVSLTGDLDVAIWMAIHRTNRVGNG